ncbi:dipeptidyl aminopeptidase [Mycena galericulata]|nr:dipeptidyl aminopeptidase [Mycena galericulata]
MCPNYTLAPNYAGETGRSGRTGAKATALSFCLLTTFLAFAIFRAIFTSPTIEYRPALKNMTKDDVFNGFFNPIYRTLQWVSNDDGVFVTLQGGSLVLVNLLNNSTTFLVSMANTTEENGRILSWFEWKVSPSLRYVLIKSDVAPRWNRSKFGNYYIHDLATGETSPLLPPVHPPRSIQAFWSPTVDILAFIHENDVYIAGPFDSPVARITYSGNETVFNGIPDWVYEEEVLYDDRAMWWSPDSSHLVFLTFDDTAVDEYSFPIYDRTDPGNPFPQRTHRYPVAGRQNPEITVNVLCVERLITTVLRWEDSFLKNEGIVFQVVWLGNHVLLLKEMNRVANDGHVIIFNFDGSEHSNTGYMARKLRPEAGEGWIDNAQTVYPLGGPKFAYLDIVPTSDGYNHIALFSSSNAKSPIFLTKGPWEVTGTIIGVGVHAGENIVFFQAAYPSSTQRHIFSTSLLPAVSSVPFAVTNTTQPAFFRANVSPQGRFMVLTYQGPEVPWQHIFRTNGRDLTDMIYVLEHNDNLRSTVGAYKTPTISFSTIVSDGFALNVKEIRPPSMDLSGRKKYPTLFSVSGAPTSQMVNLLFRIDWDSYLACLHDYVIVTVDGRGTAYQGRKLRNPVKGQLGLLEAADQLRTAASWANLQYVDQKRIGIWGASYGGYVTVKAIEADRRIFSLAMAIAPVVDWRMYDSVFTERYMDYPSVNPEGYSVSAVHNVTAFSSVDFLLAHGSADINVHLSHSALLLDMFHRAQVRGYWFRMYPDSDHQMKGYFREVFEFMTLFLQEKWG